ncbi:MAG: hypothetical protein ACM3U1_00510 [Chloroflexota bacterium]
MALMTVRVAFMFHFRTMFNIFIDIMTRHIRTIIMFICVNNFMIILMVNDTVIFMRR